MGRLAVYGGSFNPVHRGHIHLAEQFRLRLRLDRVVLMPAGIPPHKAAPDLAAAPDRLAMCRLAVGGTPWLAWPRPLPACPAAFPPT